MATRLEALLDKMAQNAPNALIVLAQLTPLGHNDANWTTYNAKTPGIVGGVVLCRLLFAVRCFR